MVVTSLVKAASRLTSDVSGYSSGKLPRHLYQLSAGYYDICEMVFWVSEIKFFAFHELIASIYGATPSLPKQFQSHGQLCSALNV